MKQRKLDKTVMNTLKEEGVSSSPILVSCNCQMPLRHVRLSTSEGHQ